MDLLICPETLSFDLCYCNTPSLVKETSEGVFITCNTDGNTRLYGTHCLFFVPINGRICISCKKRMYSNICQNPYCRKYPLQGVYLANKFTCLNL